MLFRKNTNDFVYIGGKKVEVRKLSVKQWREVFGALNQLPGVIFSAITSSDKSNLSAIIVAAVDICFDEVVDIIRIASGLTKADIEENAALDEIVDYIEKLIEKNNFEATLKKLKAAGSLLFPTVKSPEKADDQRA